MTDYQAPPQNMDAEMAVLGSLIVDPSQIDDISPLLKTQDFYRDSHRIIYETLIEMNTTPDCVIDLITLGEFLNTKGYLSKIGGHTYLVQLHNFAGLVPIPEIVQAHARIIARAAKRRRLIKAGAEIQRLAADNEFDVEEAVNKAESLLFSLADDDSQGQDYYTAKDAVLENADMVDQAVKSKNGLIGLDTGFIELNVLTSGLKKQELTILAARPSMGKTALALNIADIAAVKYNEPVAIFSLEMPKWMLIRRMIAARAKIDTQALALMEITAEEMTRYNQAEALIAEAPIYIDDTPGISAMDLFSKSRRIKRKHGLSLIIIDYLQLMSGDKRLKRFDLVSENTRMVKQIARELDVPVLCLSQLSREVEKRQEKKPMLSDLRESGELEQTADMVWFIYRDEYYNPQTTKKKGIAEIIVAKQRNGPLGNVELHFDKRLTRFGNLYKGLGTEVAMDEKVIKELGWD